MIRPLPEERALSIMVITCGDCGARFRLDVALLKGAKGVRVRCRRCGGNIVVQRPEAPLVLTADDVVPIYPGVPSAEPKGGTSPAPEEGTAVRTDLSGAIRPEPVPSPQPEAAGPRTDPGQQEMHDPGIADPVPPVPEREVFPGGRSPKLKYSIIAGLSILLLAGGTLYFGTTKPGRERLGKVFPTYDIRDVKWSIEKQTASGTLFVVKGKVANFGKGPSDGIGIQATLLGKDNQALVEKTAFAGNILDEASLRRMDRPGIAGAMSNRFGEGNVNKEIPPGKALPFMVIFFDPPLEIEAVMVKAIDAR